MLWHEIGSFYPSMSVNHDIDITNERGTSVSE